MTPAGIAIGAFWTFVAAVLAWSFWPRGSRKRIPCPAPTRNPVLDSICPAPAGTFLEDEVPTTPSFIVEPYIFRDAHLGIAMLGGLHVRARQFNETLGGYAHETVEEWIFRVHGDHWCTVRRARPEDIATVANLKRISRTILLERSQ